MSNLDSRNIPDTRGRPRSPDMEEVSDQIEKAYLTNKLPLSVPGFSRKQIKKLRNSAAYKDMQKEVGVNFRILPDGDGMIVCLRRS